ncbi:metallophosphoesterase [Methanococcus aeolicus]|uniref:metallophosphoesterase n=1 Tax=Methanococcus aeolicus TaxID=42879 RepID=UPI0021C7E54F|nr:metallophosphoesterase [Methanococcus aeolicus]UXM85130.1 metallophosphoesterase [Methanococcus aeolicus]
MRIISLTDLHGKPLQNINRIIEYEPDILIVSGDITHFGRDLKIIKQLKELEEKNIKIMVIPGNCDNNEAIEELNKYNINIDKKIIEINKIKFIGLGGSNTTPFNTPNEYTEEELYNNFKETVKNQNKEELVNNFILVCHAPPKNTMADRVGNENFGSSAIRKIIEEYRPILTICGHIHESRCIDKINDSYIVNPSQNCFLVCDIYNLKKEILLKNMELFDIL